jgi:Ca2+-binding EF-hand superfamily protein
MIEGGVTQDEFSQIIGMIDEALSEEEYEELIKILNKYQ